MDTRLPPGSGQKVSGRPSSPDSSDSPRAPTSSTEAASGGTTAKRRQAFQERGARGAEARLTRSLTSAFQVTRKSEKVQRVKNRKTNRIAAEKIMMDILTHVPPEVSSNRKLAFSVVHILGGEKPLMRASCVEGVGVTLVSFESPDCEPNLVQVKSIASVLSRGGDLGVGAEFLAAAATGAKQSLYFKMIVLCDCMELLEQEQEQSRIANERSHRAMTSESAMPLHRNRPVLRRESDEEIVVLESMTSVVKGEQLEEKEGLHWSVMLEETALSEKGGLQGMAEGLFCAKTVERLQAHFAGILQDFREEIAKDKGTSRRSLKYQTQLLIQIARHGLLGVAKIHDRTDVKSVLTAFRKLRDPGVARIIKETQTFLARLKMLEAKEKLMKAGFEIKLVSPSSGPFGKLVGTGFVPEQHAEALRDYALELSSIQYDQPLFFAVSHFLFVNAPNCDLSELLFSYRSEMAASGDASYVKRFVRELMADMAKSLCAAIQQVIKGLRSEGKLIELLSVCDWCLESLQMAAGKFAKAEVSEILAGFNQFRSVEFRGEKAHKILAEHRLKHPDKKPQKATMKALLGPSQGTARAVIKHLNAHYIEDIEPVVHLIIQLGTGNWVSEVSLCLELAQNEKASPGLRRACFDAAVPYVKKLDTKELSHMVMLALEFVRGTGKHSQYLAVLAFEEMDSIKKKAIEELVRLNAKRIDLHSVSRRMGPLIEANFVEAGAFLGFPFVQWHVGQCMAALMEVGNDETLEFLMAKIISIKRSNFEAILLRATHGGNLKDLQKLLRLTLKTAQLDPSSRMHFISDLMVQIGVSCREDSDSIEKTVKACFAMLSRNSSELALQVLSATWMEMKVRAKKGQRLEDFAKSIWSAIRLVPFESRGSKDLKGAIEMVENYQKTIRPDQATKEIEEFLEELRVCIYLS